MCVRVVVFFWGEVPLIAIVWETTRKSEAIFGGYPKKGTPGCGC